MAASKNTVVGLGELLWDLLPDGKELGGAPANFAYITNLLGDEGIVASRVGKDRLGNAAARRLMRLGLNNTFLQTDVAHPTGTVKVEVDPEGQPQFQISEGVAWDFLEWTPQWKSLAEKADAVCFGSLAQRSRPARETIARFLRAMRPRALRVCDVNLRQAFYSADVLEESAKLAEIIKLNEDELQSVAELLGFEGDAKDQKAIALWLVREYDLKLVCVTRGALGSLLVTAKAWNEHPGFATQVADAVGAGDAFTAALVHHYLREASLAAMNKAANRMGGWVASQVGATPGAEVRLLEEICNPGRDE
jgi:fructokinase